MNYRNHRTALSRHLKEALVESRVRENWAWAALIEDHDPNVAVRVAHRLSSILSYHFAAPYYAGSDAVTRKAEGRRFVQDIIAQGDVWPPVSVVLFTTHSSGFVRETSLGAISHLTGPFALSLILIRLNDWVAPVRLEAAQKLTHILRAPDAFGLDESALIACLDLVAGLDRGERFDPGGRALVEQWLARSSVREAWRKRLMEATGRDAIGLMRAALRRDLFDEGVDTLARDAKEPAIRRLALSAALAGRASWREGAQMHHRPLTAQHDRDGLLDAALRDPSADVRAEALQSLVNTPSSHHFREDILMAALFDARLSNQDRAIFGLKRMGIDAAGRLRAALDDPLQSTRAARVLARIGDEADRDSLFARVQSANDSVRMQILGALAYRKHESSLAQLLDIALNDASDQKARRAAASLAAAGQPVPVEAWIEQAKAGRRLAARGAHLGAVQRPAIGMIRLAVALRGQGGEELSSQILKAAARKRNRGAFKPDRHEIECLKCQLANQMDLRRWIEQAFGAEMFQTP